MHPSTNCKENLGLNVGDWTHAICLWDNVSKHWSVIYSGDNCIQNFHLGRYIVEYTVGNLVLQRRVSRAVKRDLRTYIRQYTSPNENLEYGYPHSNALLQFPLKLKRCKQHFIQRYVMWCDVGYTVANFWHYPIRPRVTKASALEYQMAWVAFCVLLGNVYFLPLSWIETRRRHFSNTVITAFHLILCVLVSSAEDLFK